MNVRTYERIAMLSTIVQNMYIDNEWVAQEYLRRCKQGAWTKEGTDDALKCWNLERVIDAETYGKPNPKELTLNDFMGEEEGMEVKMICWFE